MASESPTLGHLACQARGLDYAETFLGQFVISESAVACPDNWRSERLGSWIIRCCPSLRCIRLLDPLGEHVGLILGIALTESGQPLPPVHSVSSASLGHLEGFVEGLAGRFLAIILTGSITRLYVDPSCGLVPFYAPETRRVAASVPLCVDRPLLDHPTLPLKHHHETARTYYLFGDTADAGVRRMLANHYLDLQTFETRRHWPREDDDFAAPEDPEAVLDAIMQRLRARIEGLVRNFRCGLPITGGGDSRILLAAASDVLPQVKAFFVYVNNWASAMDALVATSIAQRINVPLQVISATAPRVQGGFGHDDLERIAQMHELRTSFQNRPTPRRLYAEVSIPDVEVVLRGGLVEMSRSNKWKPRWGPFTPERGLRALAHPFGMDDDFAKAQLPRYRAWLETLPQNARERAVDIGHCELWLPSMGNTTYAAYVPRFFLNPFNDRQILRSCSSLSYEYRRSGKPQTYLMERYMPELKGVPYKGTTLNRSIEKVGSTGALFSALGWKYR